MDVGGAWQRLSLIGVRAIGRATQGVRLIDIEAEDSVVSIARLVEKEEDGDGPTEPGDGPPEPLVS